MKLRISVIFLLSFALLMTSLAPAQEKGKKKKKTSTEQKVPTTSEKESSTEQTSAKMETARGLHTTTFDTLNGTVTVYLPDDLTAGDTISGTVTTEPKGQTEAERMRNSDELNGYVVEVENQPTPVKDKSGKWTVPAAATTGTIRLLLKNRKAKETGSAEVPVREQPKTRQPGTDQPKTDQPRERRPDDYHLPGIGQAGRPIQITGPFDGDFANTGVRVGGQETGKLAESPRKIVVESPRDVVGQTEIELDEGGVVTRQKMNNLRVTLSAPKTNLLKGEKTPLKVEVAGLEGLDRDVPITIVNHSPSVITLSGGDSQSKIITPDDVTSDGRHTFTLPITGIRSGGFQIVATATDSAPPDFSCCEKDIELPAQVNQSKGATKQVANNTNRRVEIDTQFAVKFACDTARDQECVGKFEVAAESVPLQWNAQSLNHDIRPRESSVTTDYVKAKCDGRAHTGQVTVKWQATYPGTDQIKGTLVLKLTVPDAKGKIKHTYSTDVEAGGNVVNAGNPKLEPVREGENPPDYSCCEKDIKFGQGRTSSTGSTAQVTNNTQRDLKIDTKIPIQFTCDQLRDRDCIGKIQAVIDAEPLQFNNASRNYDVKPIKSEMKTDWIKNVKCDGKLHLGTVTVTWRAVYPGIHQIKGVMTLKLTVPAAKGQINHTYSISVDASGNVVGIKDPKIEPIK